MSCKHLDFTKIAEDGTKTLYCKAKDKEISDFECNNCLLKLDNTDDILKDLFGGIFGEGVRK